MTCPALQEKVYNIQYSKSNLNEFLNTIKITKCFGLKSEVKSDICLIEFLIVFQESVIFCCFPTSVRSMYSKRHLGYCIYRVP